MEDWERELQKNKAGESDKRRRIGIGIMAILLLFGLFFIQLSFAIGDYDAIDIADAVIYKGEYSKYFHDTQGSSDAYYVVLDDGSSFRVPIERQSLRDTIKGIQAGQTIEILAHPKSQIILSLSVDGNNIIDFDYAQEYLTKDSNYLRWGLFGIGVAIVSSIAIYNLIVIIKKLSRK